MKIISGGQTGADRAALDFAIQYGSSYGGFVPKGRIAEDGPISGRYLHLVETESSDPAERTRLNVKHSDATLILSHGSLSGGSKLAQDFAHALGKPTLHIDFLVRSEAQAVDDVIDWLTAVRPELL